MALFFIQFKMRNVVLLISIILFCTQCNSQTTEQNMKPKLKNSTGKIVDEDYFVGNWQNTKTYHVLTGKKVVQSPTNCNQKSYWKFKKEEGILKQSRFTATGKDCERFVSANFGTVTLDNNQMTYFHDDIVISVKINVLSQDEFALMTRELVAGNLIDVELIYTRMK